MLKKVSALKKQLVIMKKGKKVDLIGSVYLFNKNKKKTLVILVSFKKLKYWISKNVFLSKRIYYLLK